MRTNLSYEYASKYMDASEGKGAVDSKKLAMDPREKQIM